MVLVRVVSWLMLWGVIWGKVVKMRPKLSYT